jgi:hypothetical protein
VIKKITSDEKDNVGNPLGFPALQSCGGFEMKQCTPNCRDLKLIDSSWNATALRANLGGGQGKIYLVPIQKSLSTKPLIQKSADSTLFERCNICNKEILVRELRKHIWECNDDDDLLSATDDNMLLQPTFSGGESSQNASVSGPSQVVDLTEGLEGSNSDGTSNPYTPAASGETLTNENSIVPGGSVGPVTPVTEVSVVHVNLTRALETSTTPSPSNSCVNDTVDEVANTTIEYCLDNDVHNPVEILRCFQKNMVTGRELDVEHAHEVQEGETNFIMVDRQNILETGFDEIGTLSDHRKTLEVQFYNEVIHVL